MTTQKDISDFQERKSMEPGHVFIAEAEEANDLNRILGNEYDINIEDTDEAFQEALAKAELAAGSLPVGERKRFSEVIAECDDPVPMMQFVEDKNYSKLFPQQHGLRLMCTSSASNFVNIDYTLQTEPDYYQPLQKNGCQEHFQWKSSRYGVE